MFLTRTEYDRGVNTFSPEGRLFQVEYAIEAIKLGSTAIGLKTKDGVVLAVEKRVTSPLLEPSSVEKIMEIDEHIGCAMSGLIADARTLVEHARVETQNHRFSYGEPMTVESTTQAICDLALRFGEGDEESMSRPFGVSLLIAGHDENGPSLYYTDPSGTFWQCNAKAIGSGSEGADSSLQEQYNKELTLQEAETIALSILKQVMEEKVTPNNVDIAKVSPNYHLYTPAEVEAVIARFWKPVSNSHVFGPGPVGGGEDAQEERARDGLVQQEAAGQAPASRSVRHGKGGYAVVDNHLEMRVAVCSAEGIFFGEDDIPDLIDEGFHLASN
uniref:Proteasome alpha-type subunits domain-containing protein n=1 Tax=Oryza rufipogon TaxID=4529 RepID=A0A0E0RAW7_ORYRU